MVQQAQHLLDEPLEVVVEVDRVDVLVLLRRVLRVGDRPVGPRREPLGVLGDPWMIRGGLQREVERDLHAVRLGLGDEVREVGDRAQIRVDRVVTAGGAADRPRRAGIVGADGERVVRPLAERVPMDESAAGRSHRTRAPPPPAAASPPCGTCRRPSCRPSSAGRPRCAGRIVPVADPGALALDPQRDGVAQRGVRHERARLHGLGEPRILERGPLLGRAECRVGKRGERVLHDRALRRTLEQLAARREHELHVLPRGDLDLGGVELRGPLVGEGADPPRPGAVGGDLRERASGRGRGRPGSSGAPSRGRQDRRAAARRRAGRGPPGTPWPRTGSPRPRRPSRPSALLVAAGSGSGSGCVRVVSQDALPGYQPPSDVSGLCWADLRGCDGGASDASVCTAPART